MLDEVNFSSGDGPVYRRIADVIAEAITAGNVAAGDRLPPQRELARQAGVNLTTITRAFAELQRRGLVDARPGRGSVVMEPGIWPASFKSAPDDEQGFVDLSVNRPATTGYLDALARIMPDLSQDKRYSALQDFHAPEGPQWARDVVGGWFAQQCKIADMLNVAITNGAQHGLACVLGAIAYPGDTILCDAVTYQGITALCRSLGLNPVAVAMDGDGMLPDEMLEACRTYRPRAVFLVPDLHNPTTITMPILRRRQIEAVARAEDVLIIEDGVYRALKPSVPDSFISFAPDITIHVTSFSKSVAPGLRFGAVFAAPNMLADIAAMLRIDCWSTSPLNALIACRLVEEGYLERIILAQRLECAARQQIVRDVLAGLDVMTDDDAAHAWLRLPEPWRVSSFVRVCAQHGVGVLSGEVFSVSRDVAPHAVRINVAAARSRDQLMRALQIVAQILSGKNRLMDASA